MKENDTIEVTGKDFEISSVWMPTTQLRYTRYVENLGNGMQRTQLVLQQMWQDQQGNTKWDDIPIVDAE